MKDKKLPREFYTRANVLTVTRELLGKLLVVPAPDGTRVSGIIVEAESYRGPEDRASHAYGSRRTNLTNGPGKLCIALGIDRPLDRADLLGNQVWIEEGEKISARRIASGPRIGIDYAEEWAAKPWRF